LALDDRFGVFKIAKVSRIQSARFLTDDEDT